MSDNTQIEPNYEHLFDIDNNPELKAVREREEALNQELGFEIPSEEEENVSIWIPFFGIMRKMYAKNYLTKEYIEKALLHFYEQSNEEREGITKRFIKLHNDHDARVSVALTMADQYDMMHDLNQLVDILPEELHEEFFYYITKGEEMPRYLKQNIKNEINEDELALDKLEKVLNQGHRLDINDLESLQLLEVKKPATGQPLSPQDLLKKFNIPSKAAPKLDQQPAKPKPSIGKIVPQADTAPAKKAPVDQTQMKSAEDLQKAAPEPEKHEVKKPKGLGDLLK